MALASSHIFYQGKDSQGLLRMTAPKPVPAPSKRAVSPLLGIIASSVFVAALLAILLYFDIHHTIVDLLHWVDAQGIWGSVLLILPMALVALSVLPGVLLTTGGGFVMTVVIVFYLNKLARRALSQYTEPADNEESVT